MKSGWLCCVLLGCGLSPAALTSPALDHGEFVRFVEPVLERRCGNPTCHGEARRPLRIFAPERFRADPTRLHEPGPLTDDELRANERAAATFAAEIMRAEDSLLLTKALARVPHLGDRVFADESDGGYQALLSWLRSGGLP